jgi:hypothetical protein
MGVALAATGAAVHARMDSAMQMREIPFQTIDWAEVRHAL